MGSRFRYAEPESYDDATRDRYKSKLDAAVKEAQWGDAPKSSLQRKRETEARKYTSSLLRQVFRAPVFRSGQDLSAVDLSDIVDEILRDEKLPAKVAPRFKEAIVETIQIAMQGDRGKADDVARERALQLSADLVKTTWDASEQDEITTEQADELAASLHRGF